MKFLRLVFFVFSFFFKKKIVIVPLEGAVLDWPVQVSFAEASAWCKWRGDGSRLPSEAEWYHAAFSESNEKGFSYRPFPWGSQTPTPFHGNFGFSRFSPSGVMEFPLSRKLSEEKYIVSFFLTSRQLLGSFGSAGQWMGMDIDSLCWISWLCSNLVHVFGLQRRLFRWEALCSPRRIVCNRA